MLQLLTETNCIIVTSLLREMMRRSDERLPIGEHIRGFMVFAEQHISGVAKVIREKPQWERFQMRYNECQQHFEHYPQACHDLLYDGIIASLLEFGYTETISDEYHLEARTCAGGYTLALYNSKNNSLIQEGFTPVLSNVFIMLDLFSDFIKK